MKPSERCLELIKRFEGFEPRPYLCPGGYFTIGYGHVIRPGETFENDTISRKEAERLLAEDLLLAMTCIAAFVKVPLTQGEYDALCSFIYNLGCARFKNSTMLRLINEGRKDLAAEEFGRWVYAGGKRLKGLEERRKAERELFLS